MSLYYFNNKMNNKMDNKNTKIEVFYNIFCRHKNKENREI